MLFLSGACRQALLCECYLPPLGAVSIHIGGRGTRRLSEKGVGVWRFSVSVGHPLEAERRRQADSSGEEGPAFRGGGRIGEKEREAVRYGAAPENRA